MDVVGLMKAIDESTRMDDTAILRTTIDDFEKSTPFMWMKTGQRYYRNENDIRNRKQLRYLADGSTEEDTQKPNNRIAHPFMKLAVDEKVHYLLGESPTFGLDRPDQEDEQPEPDPLEATQGVIGAKPKAVKPKADPAQEYIDGILDDAFDDVLTDLGTDASNAGIAWLHPFIDDDGELAFINVEPDQCIPLWGDDAHTKLEGMIRHYFVTEYVGYVQQQVEKVELWEPLTVTYYTSYNGQLVLDIDRMGIDVAEQTPVLGHYAKREGDSVKMFGWGKVPFIPFKNNSLEMPDVQFVKWLIDEYDKRVSDNANTLEEIQELVYVLKNYGGTDLAQFMRDLKLFKAIKVDDDGGVDTLHAELNPDAHEAHLDRLKGDFHEFGQSVDKSLDKLGNAPSGVALEFMYAGLKLKTNAMERKFKAGFRLVAWFMAEWAKVSGTGAAFEPKQFNVTFTRSTITNIKESIETVNTATSTHSLRTALEHSPWVDDVDEELARIEEEGKTSLDADLQRMKATLMPRTAGAVGAPGAAEGAVPPEPGAGAVPPVPGAPWAAGGVTGAVAE